MLAGKFPLDPKKSSQALFQVELQGRWQVIQEEPMIILDACHNQEGAQALVWQLDNLPSNKELVWFSVSSVKIEPKRYYLSLPILLMKSGSFNQINQGLVLLMR